MQKLRYYRRKFSSSRAFILPSELFFVRTEDGIRLTGSHLPARSSSAQSVFLVVHGLLANHRSFGILEFAESLTRFGDVWAIDLRGHGLSGGACTLGGKEALDVAAAIRFIRTQTVRPIQIVGFSMGAAACVRAAALFESADAVVAISSPATWHGRRRWAARRTRLIWRTPGGKTLLRLLTGVRIEKAWRYSDDPASVIGKISPSPVLIVQGTEDDYFPPEEAEDLLSDAGDPKDYWLIEGGGHAEGLFYDVGADVDQGRVDAFADGIVARLQAMTAGRG